MKFFITIGLLFWIAMASHAQGVKEANVKNPYGINLIGNAGAEEELSGNDILRWESLTVIEDGDSYMQDAYGHTGGEWDWECDEKCGLPPKAGSYYFRLPVDNSGPHLGLKQTVQLDAIKDTLQMRKISFSLAGYMTGFTCSDPGCGKGILSIAFTDQTGKELAKWNSTRDNHDFTAANPEDLRMMKFVGVVVENEVPTGAANATVYLEAQTGDCCNAAYVFFDNLSLVLKKGDLRTSK